MQYHVKSVMQVTHVVEGAPIQKLRAAPDGTLAVQRSLRQVEVYDPRTGTMFVLVRNHGDYFTHGKNERD